MNILVKILIAPVAIPHELCHYVAARLLGVEAKLYLKQVKGYPRYDWQYLVITLAPIMVGLAMLSLVWIAYKELNTRWVIIAQHTSQNSLLIVNWAAAAGACGCLGYLET